jgi:hypothetical protein
MVRDCRYIARVKSGSERLQPLLDAAKGFAEGTDYWVDVQPGFMAFHFERQDALMKFCMLGAKQKLQLLTPEDLRRANASNAFVVTPSVTVSTNNKQGAVMTPLKAEFYGRIGKTLLEIQLAEQALQICVSYFVPAEEAKTIEEIEALAADARTKTLGELIKLMRKRIVVSQDFDATLTKFVDDRNAMAHRFLRVSGVNLATDEGLKSGIQFLKKLSSEAGEIYKTILGLVRVIDDAPKGDENEEHYRELAKVIFGGQ